MMTLRPGSHAYSILSILSITGEIPVRSLKLAGNERVLKALVHKMTEEQEYRFQPEWTEEKFRGKLLRITGKGRDKAVRLTKKALPILDWIHPGAYRYYMASFWNHRFPGDKIHIDRIHRVAESVLMCQMAGIECRAYCLPPLQNQEIRRVVPAGPSCYLARDLKKVGGSEANKTKFTRLTGVVYSGKEVYAVYNTRNALMKWKGMGEFKALQNLIEITRLNAGISTLDSAILFGESDETALKTLRETEKNHRLELRFDSIYQQIYFVPMNSFGARLLKILIIPGWKQRLMNLLFEKETQSGGTGMMEYDAYLGGKYVYSFLDQNLARLIRLREAFQAQANSFEILCFPEQRCLLEEYLGHHVPFKFLDMKMVEEALEMEE